MDFFADAVRMTVFGQLAMIVIPLAIAALGLRLRVVTKWIVVALMLVTVSIVASTFYLDDIFYYEVSVTVLNSYTDPAERTFLRDYDAKEFSSQASRDLAKSYAGDSVWQAVAGIFYAFGLVLILIGAALGLLVRTRSPSSTGASGPLGILRGANRLGLLLAVVGALVFFANVLVSNVLVENFGVEYHRGEGIGRGMQSNYWAVEEVGSEEIASWFWPVMILDKVAYVGASLFWIGILILAFPLVKIVWHFVQSTRDMFRVLGFALVVFGASVTVFDFLVLQRFIIPTLREIAAPTRGIMFLSSFSYYPGWLRTSISIMDLLGPISIIAGIVFILLGRYTLPILGSLIAGYFESWFRASGGGSTGSDTSDSSSSSEPTSGGGAGYGAYIRSQGRGR